VHCSYLESNGELHMVGDTVIASLETKTITYKTLVYKIDFLLDQTLVWSRVNEVGDLTLLVSKQ
jgi:hypothetical protein